MRKTQKYKNTKNQNKKIRKIQNTSKSRSKKGTSQLRICDLLDIYNGAVVECGLLRMYYCIFRIFGIYTHVIGKLIEML